MKRYSTLVLLAAVSLTGCQSMSEQEAATLDPDFGNAVRTNMAVQVVNPDAGKSEQPAPPLEGQKGERALKDYRKEKGDAPSDRLLIDIGSSR